MKNEVMSLEAAAKLAERIDLHENLIRNLQQNAVSINYDIIQMKDDLFTLGKMHNQQVGFIYVASPYSHPEEERRHDRYLQVMHYVMKLLQNREWCYSPIVHCHEMARIHFLSTDAMFWLDYNYAMLSQARELRVLCLPGWKDSVGVKGEIAFWRHAKHEPPKYVEV